MAMNDEWEVVGDGSGSGDDWEVVDNSHASRESIPWGDVPGNAMSDVKDIGMNALSFPKQLLIDQPIQAGKDIYNTAKGMFRGQPFSQTPIANDLHTPIDMARDFVDTGAKYINHPIESFKEHPVKMPMNVAGTIAPMAEGYTASRRFLAPAAKAIADVAEQGSGLTYKTPGVLRDVFNEPKRLFAPGVEKARELYGQTEQSVRRDLSGIGTHQEFVEKALELARKGDLTPSEALEGRKSLDKIKKNVPGSYYRGNRAILDNIAKQDFAIADKVYSQGVKSDNMRRMLPMNKSGTPSIVKMGVGSMFKASVPFFSPLVQSVTSAGMGVADKLATGMLRSAPMRSVPVLNSLPIKGGNNLNDNFQDQNKGNASSSPSEPSTEIGNHAPILSTPTPSNQGKVLDEKNARKYLKRAEGNKNKARQLAMADGWVIA